LRIDTGGNGLLDLLSNEDDLAAAERFRSGLCALGYTAELMDRAAVLELEPAPAGPDVGALWLDEPMLRSA
jgi:glycine/D-amino acid oxidase-like deaminating enzyme